MKSDASPFHASVSLPNINFAIVMVPVYQFEPTVVPQIESDGDVSRSWLCGFAL